MITIIEIEKKEDSFFIIYKKDNKTFTFNGNAEECGNEMTGENYEQ